jgi:hypothetical protein
MFGFLSSRPTILVTLNTEEFRRAETQAKYCPFTISRRPPFFFLFNGLSGGGAGLTVNNAA